MSSRQSREKERSRLRMDNYAGSSRAGIQRGRPSPPRRREVDNVVKKARKESSGSQRTYWDKKILEAEEKDPNRWRHSGFKELYLEDPNAKMDRDSSRSRSRSPVPRARSPAGRGRSPLPRARSPAGRGRSPPPRARSPPSRARTPPSRARSPGSRRSPANGKSRGKKPTTPPPRRARSESVSSGSLSSCSDSQCSVCLQHVADSQDQPREKRRPPPPKEPKLRPTARSPISRNPPPRNRSRSRSFSVPRSNNPLPVVKEKPRKKAKKRDREKKKKDKQARAPTPIVHIKQESFSDDSSSPSPPTPRMTLSERFGKMAQWSVDRDLKNHRNLRITSGGLDRTLTVEMDEPPSPPMANFQPRPPASNHALMEDGSWDDVRVRYAYYKEQGFLQDLTLSDYIKWEEWWYKYQDWLDNERYFESRAAHAHPHARRRPPRPTLSITPPPMHSLPPHHGHAMPPM